MAEKVTRGSVSSQEIREDYIVRDTRGAVTKALHWLRSPTNLATLLILFAAVAFLFPAFADLCLLSSIGFVSYGLTRKETAPLKLPVQSGVLDPNERSPADGSPSPASGIFFLGNEIGTGKEVWLTNSDCRQHFLVLGTTGAGKTEALLGFATNAVSWGSGFLFCDGKGDVSLFAKVYALARRFGREDDLLVLNYMTGNQDLGASGGRLRSNSLNPFATGSSDTLTQMVVSLMDDAGGDGAMWKGRATAMFTGVMRALTWLRDQQIVDLNVSEIRDHLNLKRIIDLSDQSKYPDMPQQIRKSIDSYLSSLPGFQPDKGYKQSQTTLDQHGYLEMQFTKILGSLADVYGHIFHTPFGEIDMTDVVLNRRILVIMLPALEKSNDEIANLGKIVVATLKGMMGGTLGNEIEGTWDHVVEKRPTNSPSPFIVILDEVGYYMVDGMDLMSAQARSLGFSLVFAGQDLNAMKRLNEKVFGSVQGNTSTKLVMKTEDPETAKIAIEAAGKAIQAKVGAFQGHVQEVGSRSYTDNMEARLEAVDRINLRDLRDQDAGEMHVLHKDVVVRTKSFYAAPEGAVSRKNLVLRANHFIAVAKPDAADIESQQILPEIVDRLTDPQFAQRMKQNAANFELENDEIGEIARTLRDVRAVKNKSTSPVEAACISLARLAQKNQSISTAYGGEIRKSFSGAGGVPPRVNHIKPPVDRDGFRGRMPEDFGDDHDVFETKHGNVRKDIPEGFGLPEDMPRKVPPAPVPNAIKKPAHRPVVRKGVTHGVDVAGDVHDMADRLSSNEQVMKSLAALDFDEKVQTREGVDSAIEEALSMADEGFDEDVGPFDKGDISKTTSAVRTAMPEFEAEGDGDEDGESGTVVDSLLSQLMIQDEE